MGRNIEQNGSRGMSDGQNIRMSQMSNMWHVSIGELRIIARELEVPMVPGVFGPTVVAPLDSLLILQRIRQKQSGSQFEEVAEAPISSVPRKGNSNKGRQPSPRQLFFDSEFAPATEVRISSRSATQHLTSDNVYEDSYLGDLRRAAAEERASQ